ncbi:ABC transporter ATP-binding protein [Lapillicoccus sp.]|uniref:ABC transporter ATP-binding protein n=1 Tax=Lapillicoccus sp. TaxID=1909287 RepID=UPI003265BDBB
MRTTLGALGDLVVDARVDRGSFHLDVATTVAAGEVLGVIGPNGAGKTTLMRALAGLLALTSGSIRLGGVVLDDAETDTWVPPEDRPVGIVFQDYRLFPHLTVLDNVAFAARARGADRSTSRRLVQPWVERLDLAALASRKPGELSGGQAQRVALARALASEPGLLLLDEPLAALDARTRLDVRTTLRKHLADFAGPVCVISHDPLDAMVMTDRLLIVEEGRVVQEGAPAQVARHPATDYVARLVGLNLYAGVLVDPSGAVRLDDGGRLVTTVTGDLRDATRMRVGGRVLVSLRPSALTVHTGQPSAQSARNIWRGTVVGLELLGDRVRVEVRGEPPAIVDVTPAAVAELGLRSGTPVWLAAKATDATAYPQEQVSRAT